MPASGSGSLHVIQEPTDNQTSCLCCNEKFATADLLHRHMEVHLNVPRKINRVEDQARKWTVKSGKR